MLETDYLDDILQCPFENAGTGVPSVVCRHVEQIPLDLLPQKVMKKVFYKHTMI